MYVVKLDGKYLFLAGPFKYAFWVEEPDRASKLLLSQASQYAEYFGGQALELVG